MFFVLIIWFILSVVIGGAARQRGRDAFGWFLLSILTTPLLAGILLLLFPPLRDPTLAVDDGALQESIRKGMPIEPSQRRGLGSLIIILATLGLIAVAAISSHNSDMSVKPIAEAASPDSRGPAASTQSATKNEYAAVASLPCTNYLIAHGRTQFSSLSEPLIETISARGDGLGSGTNIVDFIATECRLHEKITIGQAVENLFDQQRHDRLPRIPIGGATSEAKAHASWEAFDKWIHHKGPRPKFSPIPPPEEQTLDQAKITALPDKRDATQQTPAVVPFASASLPFSGRYCDAANQNIERVNQGARNQEMSLPPENRNSPKNPNYKPSRWQILSCDETTDPIRVGGMLDTGGGAPWYFEALKSAYPFPSGEDIQLSVCSGAAFREFDILMTPACHASGELRKMCEKTPGPFKCETAPDPQACARRNAICARELAHSAPAVDPQSLRLPVMKPPESSANGATSLATPLSQAEIKAMRVRLASLWNVQADAAHPEELRVTVRIRLNRDRRLAAPPQVVSSGTSPEYQAAADAAVRAVVQGQPYTMLRYETYEQWKYMDIDFDPKQMFHKREAESTAGEYTPASPSPVASSPAVVSQAAKKEANWQPVNLPPNVDGTAYSYDRNSIAIITDEHGQMNGAEMAAKIVGGDVSIRGKSLLLSFDCNGSGRFRINHSYPLQLLPSLFQEEYLGNIACGAASCEIDRRQNGSASICHF